MDHTEHRAAYLELFSGRTGSKSRKLLALEIALDTRKFEIELYWKRATYFWAFAAAAFGAYFTISGARDFQRQAEATLLVCCLGLVFSVAWYLVNRGSKYWQNNWEKHVDLLEDEVVGPLYKTLLTDSSMSLWNIKGPYPFSVSKINQWLSFFVSVVFLILLMDTISRSFSFGWPPDAFPTACLVITCVALVVLYREGRTDGKHAVMRAEVRRSQLESCSEKQ